jgi:hypothetical protein
MMPYWVDCTCGHRTEVTETQAGTEIPCQCGKAVLIPRLSELRSQAGEAAEDPSPELVIRYLYGSGKEAVGGNACACCDATPVDRVLCFIECEKPATAEHSWLFWVFFGLMSLPLAIFYYFVKREPKVLSEGKVLEFHLSLCSACRKAALGSDSLQEVLRREPVFARLLVKYPTARVWQGAAVRK